MAPTHLKRRKYVSFGDNHEINELFCKVCGTAIGGQTSRMVGRRLDPSTKRWIETREVRFRRFNNYAELKMAFEDGSYHVTNGCNKCMTEHLSVAMLNALHKADMDLDPTDYQGRKQHYERKATEVVAVRADGGGLQ